MKVGTQNILDISGIPAQTVQLLLDDMRSRKQRTVDSFGKAKQLLTKAEALRSMMNEVGGMSSRKEDIARCTHPVESVLRMVGYMDDHRDVWLARCVKELENMLASDITTVVKGAGRMKTERIAEFMRKLD